jgi:glycosyltransferase involved in cell wall biosynthesis
VPYPKEGLVRVLTLCYEFPPIGGGGSRVVAGLSNELVRAGHSVDLVTMRFRGQPREELVNGVRVFRAECLRRSPSICSPPEMATYIARALPLAAGLVRRHGYDLNHTHFVFPDGVLAWLLKRLTGLPYILTAHGSDVPGFNPDRFTLAHRLLRPLWHRVVDGAEAVVAPSRNLANLIRRAKPEADPVLIPNGIDPGLLRPDRPRRRRILVVARLFERKGVQYVLRALGGMRHDHEVHVVGAGPYLPTLVALAREQSVDVQFHGWLDPVSSQLAGLYETADIFVLCSDIENFPMVLLEAMAAGLAIITTRGTGCDEVVGDAALLVDPGDVAGLRAALEALTRDAQRCRLLGRAARQRLLNQFSWASVARRYAALYDAVLDVPESPRKLADHVA